MLPSFSKLTVGVVLQLVVQLASMGMSGTMSDDGSMAYNNAVARRRASSLENPRIAAALGLKRTDGSQVTGPRKPVHGIMSGGDDVGESVSTVELDKSTGQTQSQQVLRQGVSGENNEDDPEWMKSVRRSSGGPVLLAPLRTRPVARLPGTIVTPTTPRNALFDSPLNQPRKVFCAVCVFCVSIDEC